MAEAKCLILSPNLIALGSLPQHLPQQVCVYGADLGPISTPSGASWKGKYRYRNHVPTASCLGGEWWESGERRTQATEVSDGSRYAMKRKTVRGWLILTLEGQPSYTRR